MWIKIMSKIRKMMCNHTFFTLLLMLWVMVACEKVTSSSIGNLFEGDGDNQSTDAA